jgi:hypothetical protein
VLRELFGNLNVLLERVLLSTVELGVSQMCARLVLRDLSEEQKRYCAEVCQQNVTFVEQSSDFLSSVMVCDASCIRHVDLELKQQSYVWKHKDFLPRKKFCTVLVSGKVCWCFLFFFFTQKLLFFSTGYLGSKLWMVFPLLIHLKLI